MTPPAPDPGDAPKRFIRDWLTFNESRPVRTRTLWKLFAIVALFLIASALLALFGGHPQQLKQRVLLRGAGLLPPSLLELQRTRSLRSQ